jgi:hypothetical protein
LFENDQYDLCQHSLIWRWRIIKHHAIAKSSGQFSSAQEKSTKPDRVGMELA